MYKSSIVFYSDNGCSFYSIPVSHVWQLWFGGTMARVIIPEYKIY